MNLWYRDVVGWLERSALRYPESIAIEDGDSSTVTYSDLDRISKAVAAGLIQRWNVRETDRVAIVMKKSSDTLIAYYSVLRTGAVYVPIDACQPLSRTVRMLRDCDPKVVLVDEDLRMRLESSNELPKGPTIVGVPPSRCRDIHRGIERLSASTEMPPFDSLSDSVAFLLYTSGSTGQPKAVIISHKNLVDFVNWCSDVFEPRSNDRFATLSPLHFSLPVFNIYLACKHGAAVCLIEAPLLHRPTVLFERLKALQVTVWFATPFALLQLADSGTLQRLTSLRLVMWGGEALHSAQLKRLIRGLPHCRCTNVLGSTEAHIVAYYDIPNGGWPDDTENLPVGIVASRFRSRIVDEEWIPVDPGCIGELWLSGPGVSAGYWNGASPAFVNHGEQGLWFRTGDLVSIREDGNLLYHGRRDRVIKRLGNRVDLGEVEACLRAHASVADVAVVTSDAVIDGQQIRAFVVAHLLPRPSIIQFKGYCAKTLATYMVPDVFIFLDELPRTPTGKLDYRVLREADVLPQSCLADAD